MKPIVTDLVAFVESGTPTHNLVPIVAEIGAVEVRGVAIKLLGWLKATVRTGKHESLKIHKEYTWCQNFDILMSKMPELQELFQVNSGKIDFRPSVPDEEQQSIQQYVYDHCPTKIRV